MKSIKCFLFFVALAALAASSIGFAQEDAGQDDGKALIYVVNAGVPQTELSIDGRTACRLYGKNYAMVEIKAGQRQVQVKNLSTPDVAAASLELGPGETKYLLLYWDIKAKKLILKEVAEAEVEKALRKNKPSGQCLVNLVPYPKIEDREMAVLAAGEPRPKYLSDEYINMSRSVASDVLKNAQSSMARASGPVPTQNSSQQAAAQGAAALVVALGTVVAGEIADDAKERKVEKAMKESLETYDFSKSMAERMDDTLSANNRVKRFCVEGETGEEGGCIPFSGVEDFKSNYPGKLILVVRPGSLMVHKGSGYLEMEVGVYDLEKQDAIYFGTTSAATSGGGTQSFDQVADALIESAAVNLSACLAGEDNCVMQFPIQRSSLEEMIGSSKE